MASRCHLVLPEPRLGAWWGRAMPCRDVEELTFRHAAKHWFVHRLRQGMALPHHGPDPTTGKLSDMGCHSAAGC
jgi:hypothetical protein